MAGNWYVPSAVVCVRTGLLATATTVPATGVLVPATATTPKIQPRPATCALGAEAPPGDGAEPSGRRVRFCTSVAPGATVKRSVQAEYTVPARAVLAHNGPTGRLATTGMLKCPWASAQ